MATFSVAAYGTTLFCSREPSCATSKGQTRDCKLPDGPPWIHQARTSGSDLRSSGNFASSSGTQPFRISTAVPRRSNAAVPTRATSPQVLSFSWRGGDDAEEAEAVGRWGGADAGSTSGHVFQEGVDLFNAGEYYKCHDVMEALWTDAQEPQRSALQGILQCSVALYHLFNQNHKGAMMELGEGLQKLHRLRVGSEHPFSPFIDSLSSVQEFLYATQIEYAACIEEYCTVMDGSESSYQLLGNFGAGLELYSLVQADMAAEGDGRLRIRFAGRRMLSGSTGDEGEPFQELDLPQLTATVSDLQQLH